MKKAHGGVNRFWTTQLAVCKETRILTNELEQKIAEKIGREFELTQMFHQLVNLITVLQLGAHDLGRSLDDPPSSHRCVESLHKANSELDAVIQNLMSVMDRRNR
jgi:hypothetical protein